MDADDDHPHGHVDWHALEVDAALVRQGVDSEQGLAAGEVVHRRANCGPNALPEPPRRLRT